MDSSLVLSSTIFIYGFGAFLYIVAWIFKNPLPGMEFMKRGKVRDIYDFGDTLLIVATDRISAFDVVMDDPIPDKGRILTQISAFWFNTTEDIKANHMISTSPGAFPQASQENRNVLEGRSMWVRKAEPLPVECIVRGYLADTGLKEYRQTGAICGIGLPPGLWESERLPQPIFTPLNQGRGGCPRYKHFFRSDGRNHRPIFKKRTGIENNV